MQGAFCNKSQICQADYIAALQSHHQALWALCPTDSARAKAACQVMLAAVKCKQNVDPALADALDGAVAEMSKMCPSVSVHCANSVCLQNVTCRYMK